jgi:hypothetical protein
MTNADEVKLRTEIAEHEQEARKHDKLAEAHRTMASHLRAKLEHRQQHTSDRSTTSHGKGVHAFHQAGGRQTSRPIGMEESGLRVTTRKW